jgi:hypothetical protein
VAEPPVDVDRLVAGYGFDAQRHLEEHSDERDSILAALERCVSTDRSGGARCLRQLATVDWERARAVARGDVPDSLAAEMVATLRTSDSPSALPDRLVAIGLIAQAPEEVALTVKDVLMAAHTMTSFDVETGMFPNEHDSLLRELAALAPEALEGVMFEEIPPADAPDGVILDDGTRLRPDTLDRDPGGARRYTLVAYLDGKAFTTAADDLGDWYDTTAVIGMLNELARRHQSSTRWQVLPTGDQTAIVVAAPGDAIRRAIDAGLIEVADPDRARQDGRASEEQVLEALRNQGY